MLTEQFVASISKSQSHNLSGAKDAGIFSYDLQPHVAQRAVYKKSVTATNSLAVSSSHIFAVQEEKSTIHVYNRAKENIATVVPLPEPICSIKLAMHDTLVVLGTTKGRIILWEICTGRLVLSSQSHFKAVTALAVDPTACLLLTGSADGIAMVWSLVTLLNFDYSDANRRPLRYMRDHQSGLTALVVGHSSFSANIAISADTSGKAIVWDYNTCATLKVILLHSSPLALALDPADRAIFASFADGTCQVVDFYAPSTKSRSTPFVNILHDKATPASTSALQPDLDTVISALSQELGPALSLCISWDTTTLITGHESGKIVSWDIANAVYAGVLATLPGPVTNLVPVAPLGLATKANCRYVEFQTVVKPKITVGALASNSDTFIPPDYVTSARFCYPLSIQSTPLQLQLSSFGENGDYPCMLQELLQEGLAEVVRWNQSAPSTNGLRNVSCRSRKRTNNDSGNGVRRSDEEEGAEFLPLEVTDNVSARKMHELQQQNEQLKVQLEALQRVQEVSFKQLAQRRGESDYRPISDI